MLCHQCGAQINDGASFCIRCGARQQASVSQEPIVQEPVLEQATAETAVPDQVPYEQPYYMPYPPQAEQPPKKPINKKKLAISLVSILLCLSLIAGIFVYFTYYATAERALRNAAEDSAESLEELLGKNSELEKVLKVLRNMDDEFTLNLSAGTDTMSFAFSNKKELLSLMLDIDSIRYQLTADNRKLVVAYPGISDELYSLPLANLGKELLDSSWMEDFPAEYQGMLREIDIRLFDIPSPKSIEDQEFYAKFEEKVQLEEVDTDIPHSKGVETVYRMHMDTDDYADYIMGSTKYMLSPVLGDQLVSLLAYSMGTSASMLEGEKTILCGLDEDDRLVAIHAVETVSDDSVVLTISLTGERNPWEKIEIYADDEQVCTISIEQEDDGLAVYVDEECFLRVDNEKMAIGPEGDTLTVYYEVRDGGCYFSIEINGQRAELEILPTCEAEMPTGKTTSILSLTEDELSALMEQVDSLFQ